MTSSCENKVCIPGICLSTSANKNDRYCTRFQSGDLSGNQTLWEDLRQRCIYQESLKHDEDIEDFYDYIDGVLETCKYKIDEDCSHQVMRKVGISTRKIDDCVRDSWFVQGSVTSSNKYFDEDRNLF